MNSPGSVPTTDINSAASISLLSYEALPKWLQDNSYIRTGYRRPQYSWSGCAHSVFGYLHNESVNILTHLFGATAFLYLLLKTWHSPSSHASVTWHDPAGFGIFLTSAIFCMGASALFHTANCHSPSVRKRCHMLDYAGIVVLTVGSFYPCVYYGFYCDPYLQALYIGSITVAGLGAAYVVLSPHYATPAYRWARTSVFLTLGLTAIVPVIHGLWLYGFLRLRNEMGLLWLVASGASYVVGALIYASRWPERWHPGRFDYFGASHQIFHVCVVLAALAHYMVSSTSCVTTAFEHRHGLHKGLCDLL
ncbi:HlyIII-domain-containing protein [Ceratobasidium sp. AG-I]|nr:HlyIII-domain-containing protein [Ceratobasidium sp. AG-I]